MVPQTFVRFVRITDRRFLASLAANDDLLFHETFVAARCYATTIGSASKAPACDHSADLLNDLSCSDGLVETRAASSIVKSCLQARFDSKRKPHEWTMQRIADALNVSQATISGDLGNLSTPDKLKPAKTPTNPKGAGRPKGSRKSPMLGKSVVTLVVLTLCQNRPAPKEVDRRVARFMRAYDGKGMQVSRGVKLSPPNRQSERSKPMTFPPRE